MPLTDKQRWKSAIKRFWVKVKKTDNCWEWISGLNHYGYGQFTFNNYPIGAHRFSFYLKHNYFPDIDIDHLCRNRKCVNPEHLEAVSHKENMRRGLTNVGGVNFRKTQCKNGHKFTEDNLYRRKENLSWRICKKCTRLRQKKLRVK